MNGDLFPGSRQIRGALRPERERPSTHRQEEEREIVRRHPGERQWFYEFNGRSWSVAEVYDLVGFHQACRDHPQSDIIVVLDLAASRPHLFLVELPRNHPSRFDAHGRRDPARAPFWTHGEIVRLERGGRVQQ